MAEPASLRKRVAGLLVLSADDVDRLFTYEELIEELDRTFSGPGDSTEAPIRTHHELPPGPGPSSATLLLMPAWQVRGEYLGVKVAAVMPHNPALGLPTVNATYLLMSARTGRQLAVIDGTSLTLWRTACASALASEHLSRPDAKSLLMVGAGALAPHLVQAHLAVRPSLATVTIWNRTLHKAASLAEKLSSGGLEERGVKVEATQDLMAAVLQADIVSCATTSESPLIKGCWVRPGTHLDLVGSYKPSMREVDDDVIVMSRVFVDSPAALVESGDLAVPIQKGLMAPSDVSGDLYSLCGGKRMGRQGRDEITLFKSVGLATEDLTAAAFLFNKCV